LTIISFGISAVLSLKQYYKFGTELLRWYTTGLLLITIGLAGVLLQKAVGSPIGWVGRISQYTGAVCILIGAVRFWKVKISTGLSFNETIEELSKKRINELELANEQLKQTQHFLREKEHELEDAQLMAKSGSWSYDPAIQQSTWSKGMFYIWGLDPSLGQFPFEDHQKYIHPDDYPLFESIVKEAVEHGTPYNAKLRIIRPDGIEKIINSLCDPVCAADGTVILLKGVIHDITEREQAEQQLAALAAVIRNSDNIIVIKDLDVRVIATNMAFASVSGHESVAQMLGKTDAEIFGVSEDTEPIRTYMEDERNAQCLPRGEFIIREEPVLLHDGGIRYVLTKKYPIYDADNRLIGTGNISTDITERKRAEAKIVQLSEEQSIVLAHAGVGISFVQNRHQKWSNDRMAEIFGYTPEEMCNANLSMFYASDEDYEQIGREAYPVLASGESFSKKLQMLRSDGTLFHARIVGKAVNSTNIGAGSIWIVSDETIPHELERKLQQSHDLLNSLSRQIPGTIYQFQLFPDGRSCFPYASDAIIDMYGVTPEQVIKDAGPVFAVLHPDDIGAVSDSIMESARTLEPWEFDYRVTFRTKECSGGMAFHGH